MTNHYDNGSNKHVSFGFRTSQLPPYLPGRSHHNTLSSAFSIYSSITAHTFFYFCRLPFPWFIGSLMNIPNAYVDVNATGLLCSIILLFCMLLTVIATVACFKWKLNKPLGVTYLLLYFAFVACSVLLAYKKIPCIDIAGFYTK